MEHQTHQVLGRDVTIDPCLDKFEIVATSNDRDGKIWVHLLSRSGHVRVCRLSEVIFCEVWDKATAELGPVEKEK